MYIHVHVHTCTHACALHLIHTVHLQCTCIHVLVCHRVYTCTCITLSTQNASPSLADLSRGIPPGGNTCTAPGGGAFGAAHTTQHNKNSMKVVKKWKCYGQSTMYGENTLRKGLTLEKKTICDYSVAGTTFVKNTMTLHKTLLTHCEAKKGTIYMCTLKPRCPAWCYL